MPSLGNIICGYCALTMKRSECGVIAEEMFDDERRDGYKVWSCDRFKCEGCGATVLTGFGNIPISEYYQPEYKGWAEKATVQFR